jgi:protein SCO1/2
MLRARLLLPVVLIAVLAAGCTGSNPAGKEKDKTYELHGKVVAVDLEKKTVKIDHEDIPGLMPAMTMPFHVDDAKMLDGLKAGDQVHGQVMHRSGEYVLTELKKH